MAAVVAVRVAAAHGARHARDHGDERPEAPEKKKVFFYNGV